MKRRYIYKITNLVNNKIYVGQRTSRVSFEKDDYLGSGLLIKRAIAKYGTSNFKKELLEECDETNLNDRETFWINKLNSTNSEIGYNITDKVWGGDVFTHNPNKERMRQKIKISAANRIKLYNKHADKMLYLKIDACVIPTGFIVGTRPRSKETADKLHAANSGKKYNKRLKKSKTLKIRSRRSENVRRATLGHIVTQATKDKISKACSNKIILDSTRENLRKANTGKIKIHNVKTNEERAINSDDRIPIGFVKGGKKKSAAFKEKMRLSHLNCEYTRLCVICNRTFVTKSRRAIYCCDCKKDGKHKLYRQIKSKT